MVRSTIAGLILAALVAACGKGVADAGEPAGDSEAAVVKDWLDTSATPSPAAQPSAAAPIQSAPPVDDLVGPLEMRLAANPDDVKGWRLLAQSYAFVGRMDDARVAAEKAVALGADAASLEAQILDAHTSSR